MNELVLPESAVALNFKNFFLLSIKSSSNFVTGAEVCCHLLSVTSQKVPLWRMKVIF